jgi:hypothetical protein
MKACMNALLVVLFFLTACGRKDSASAPKPTNAPASGNPLTAPADYIGAIGQARKTALKTVDLASVTKAIQMFYAQEDRHPKDLNELVKEGYLPALPRLPTGMRYQYDPNTGQVKTVRPQP